MRTAIPLTLLACSLAAPARAQITTSALRFFGTGQGQQDRVRIAIDDDAPGAASTPADVGAGDFTLELWLRGTLAGNPTSASGEGSYADERWILGNIVLDRDIWGGSARDFGLSVAGGRVRFGTGRGDAGPDADNTLEGSVNVLDDAWHHVACVREAATGRKRVFVDGALDVESPAGVSTADLSYPDDGVPGQATPWGPYLVVGAEKHDAGALYPSFTGRVDELRVWSRARTAPELAATWRYMVFTGDPSLAARWSFDEGVGPRAFDTSGSGSSIGAVIAGQPGNAEWISGFGNVAPFDVYDVFAYFCLGDGTGTACPCANHSPPGGWRGCTSSLGVGAYFSAAGSPSLAADTVVLYGASMPDAPALYFQGTSMQASGMGSVFGDGKRCAGGSVVRLGTKLNVNGASRYPGPGDAAISVRGQVTAPGVRTYQVWYRNAAAFCTPATWNLSNGFEIYWSA